MLLLDLLGIAYRSIRQRGVASLLTIISMALGVMLVVAVLTIHGVVAQSFANNASLGYNMIVGAKGGQEQLVLNTVYYLSRPVENIPYSYYLEFLPQEKRARLLADSLAAQSLAAQGQAAELAALGDSAGLASLGLRLSLAAAASLEPGVADMSRGGQYALMTDLAIPVCLGDYYGQFRVVGTTPAMFDDLVYDIENDRRYEFAQGRNLRHRSEENGYFEAVVGGKVASEIRLVELHLRPGTDLAAARAVVANYTAWTRIEEQNGTLVVTLAQGNSEDNFFQALARLQKDLDKGTKQLPAAQQTALDALRDPAAVIRRSSRPLAVGDAISPAHGSPEGHVHARKFIVVGLLKPSGTPNDRAVFVNMEGFYLMEDHAKPLETPQLAPTPADGTPEAMERAKAEFIAKKKLELELQRAADPEPLPAEQREVTAVLIKAPTMIAPGLENAINEGLYAQGVLPVKVIYNLFKFFVSPVQSILLVLTAMICVVSGISILVSIYNSMSERRHEIAVMRALGASRGTVMWVILLESTLLSLAGGLVGWAAGHVGVTLFSPLIEDRTGVSVGFFNFEPSVAILSLLGVQSELADAFRVPVELVLIPALILLAVIVGLWPALSAYRTDVAKSLGK
ncbi:MAG: ABC transporter permease [Pirellulaceae bacterium]|nr:ABC transporter permease [Pirellulaceae bacterium]